MELAYANKGETLGGWILSYDMLKKIKSEIETNPDLYETDSPSLEQIEATLLAFKGVMK